MFKFCLELGLLLLRIFGLIYGEARARLLPGPSSSSRHHPDSSREEHKTLSRTCPQISTPVEKLKASYDIVVIGSGYGAGVAASRMARASPKQSVCVLECGLERWPGGYPESLPAVSANLRFSGHWKTPFGSFKCDIGSKTGLYHWIIGKASNVFLGSGLGGTSLLNASVFLRPTPNVQKSKEWPEELRRDGSLDKYFERAEQMLAPKPYPAEFPPLRKHEVLRKQAKAVGLEESFSTVPLMTAFSTCESIAGVKLHANTLSGQESMGLNDGSKNTVLTTFLADAWSWGAEIFCGCDVQYVLKNPTGGYNIYYRDINRDRLSASHGSGPDSWVHAKKLVFLGAGSIGTTEIMLRSKERGLRVSPRVGQGMSSNGGMLAFGYDLEERVNSLGTRRQNADPPGLTISGMIDCRQIKRVDQGFVIQEGAFPTVMALLFRLVHWLLPSAPQTSRSWFLRYKKVITDIFRGRDPLEYSQVYLVLGHDNAVGKMSLRQNVLDLDMTGVSNPTNQSLVKSVLTKMTHKFGGTFKEDGVKACVHPLGGMSMSFDGTGRSGATNHTGQVFAGEDAAVHEGLIVVDGALIPRSLGANPVATITALAERAVHLASERAGLTIDLETKKHFEAQYAHYREKTPACVSFSETMRGVATVGEERCPLTLTMHIIVTEEKGSFVGKVTGHLRCSLLSPEELKIQDGSFMPFQSCRETSMAWQMVYDLNLLGTFGETFHFRGVKTIGPSTAFSPSRAWQATTHMTVSISSGGFHMGTASVRLRPTDFLRQLRSMEANSQAILISFLQKFASQVSSFLLVPFAPVQYPKDHDRAWNSEIGVKNPPATTELIKASDGYKVPLRMWEPTRTFNGEDLLFIPGGAVTHEIYALPTIKHNAIEYFTARGYRCWCVTHRAATVDRTVDQKSWTAYDARLDVAAALEKIYQRRNATPVLVIAHCAGTVALGSGLLDGTIDSRLVSGVVASQTFLTPLYAPMNELKARLGLVKIYRWIAGAWYSCHSSPSDVPIQRLINLALRFYPQTSRAELCSSSVCQRTQLPYGRLWSHANLNEATHSRIHEIFGGTSADGIEQLANMGLKGVLTDRQGRSLVTDDNLENLRGIPVFLLSGGDSQVFRPEATLRSQQLLVKKFGAGAARRKVFAGIGHLDCWMSDVAARPGGVFETVAEELGRMRRRRND